MELYMLNRQHGRMILESVENGPLLWPTVEENGVTRSNKYYELSTTEAIQADCDVKVTNIILQGLPPEVYALVSTHKVAKELWERIQMLMQGTSLTKQEWKCKLYDEFDKFAYRKGESLLNTKFLNTLPAEWSKFVTDVKLVRDLHMTNVDQLHAYLGQHEYHANESDVAEGFDQIIDFLSGNYIHYALTVSPHIYISCIKQFWNSVSGVVCFPNEEIFAGLAQICLVRNVDSSSKFYMYPRFIQLIIQNQVEDLSTHTTRFISPDLTQKVFANMRRVGKGFSGVETPLFEGMIADRQPVEEELGAEQVQVDAAIIEDVAEDVVHMATPSPPPHGILSPPQEPYSPPHQPPCPPQPQDAEVPSLLFQQQLEIVKLKARVKKLEKINMVKSSKLKRLKKVGTSQCVESSDDMENVFNQGRIIAYMDQDEGIELVVDQEKDACNTPKLARSGILGSGRATSWINNTRYILNDQKVV
nr:hypothetical protein [Tanacetum cinerariifolium]